MIIQEMEGWPRNAPQRMTPAKLALAALALLLAVLSSGCLQRYRSNPNDWAGGHNRDFEADFAECRERMEDGGIRVGGDARGRFLDCMERRGWTPK
jgi:hypothetical protein